MDHFDPCLQYFQASTVSLDDCLMRRGFDFDVIHPMCLPLTPGMDVVGHICACGSKVNPAFKEGDRVAALVRTGGNARFISVSSDSLVKVPKTVDSAEAVAMVAAFTTAYQTLKRIQQTGPMFSLLGKRVLILGGLSGVGQALIQMCAKARAEIYAPCPHNQQAYLLNVLGAHPLPLDTNQWLHLVAGQMDYVFDGICEDGLESSFKALNPQGEIICFGHMSMLKERHIGILGAPISAHVSSIHPTLCAIGSSDESLCAPSHTRSYSCPVLCETCLQVNKMWCQTKSRAKSIDIWDSFVADPETFKVRLGKAHAQ
jgi:NADPH:quinone reductase-like Zn-dependent oxidoreductase